MNHFLNRCPQCGDTNQCRCPGPKVETNNLCHACQPNALSPTDAIFGAFKDLFASNMKTASKDLAGYSLNTSNPGKIKEFQIAGLHLPTTRIDLPEPNGTPLEVIRYKASKAGLKVIVEDTSLDVDGASVGVNVKWLLDRLPEFIGHKAVFTSLIGVLEDDGMVHVFLGVTKGTISEAKGNGGFGFDQVFLPSGATKTFGEQKPPNLMPRVIAAKNFLRDKPWKVLPALHSWDGEMQHTAAPIKPIISSKLFSYLPEDRTFATEASLLRNPSLGSLIRTGFLMQSAKTGALREFKFVMEQRDRENQVQAWIFACREDRLSVHVFAT